MDLEETEKEMLRRFVRTLAEKRGVTVDEESMINDLSEKIDDAILDALPDEALDRFLMLAERGEDEVTDGEIEAILVEAGIDREKVLTKVLVDFRDDFMKEEK